MSPSRRSMLPLRVSPGNLVSSWSAAVLIVLLGVATASWAEEPTDFDADGDSDIDDLNTLLAAGPLINGYIVEPGLPDPFDLNHDGFVDKFDVMHWRSSAATVNELAQPYKLGDTNLDGVVDGADFLSWNEWKFTSSLRWDYGDFNCDGAVDGSDFILWNENKFTSSYATTRVPEPGAWMLWPLIGLLVTRPSRRAIRSSFRDRLR